jgi:NADPH:quinone reductase-like Zn-dependent oxidoreductase
MTMTQHRMQAVRVDEFGGRDRLRVETVDRPEPAAAEVLVRVRAAGVNPYDWMTREGEGADVTLPWTPGWDVSGTVEAVGPEVTTLAAGDDVFGMLSDERGAYAEYVPVPATNLLSKPPTASHTTAAALPMVGLTAWQALFDAAGCRPGQRVLVHAAAGGVGHVAVQLANWVGATTVGTASAANRAYLDDLGLDEFVNYRQERFEAVVDDCDVVLDLVGGDTLERSVDVLRPGGYLAKLPGPLTDAERALLADADADGSYPVVRWRPEQLRTLSALLEAGALDVRIDSVYPLEDVDRAHERSESGHAQGKVVLGVAPE